MNLNFDLLATKEIYIDKAYQLWEYYSYRSVVQLQDEFGCKQNLILLTYCYRVQ